MDDVESMLSRWFGEIPSFRAKAIWRWAEEPSKGTRPEMLSRHPKKMIRVCLRSMLVMQYNDVTKWSALNILRTLLPKDNDNG